MKPRICREFIFLWNPVSSEIIKLPPLDLKPDQQICFASLLSPPGNPDSVVLLFEKTVESFIFCNLVDKKWTEIPPEETDMETHIIDGEPSDLVTQIIHDEPNDVETENIDEEPSNRYGFPDSCPVNYKGRCYVAMNRELKVIDQVNPKHIMFRSLNCDLQPLNFSNSACFRTLLVESCGELCVINITKGGLDHYQVLHMEVFSLDFIKMEWSQIKSSKDRAFFVNKSISIRQPSKNFPPWSTPFWFMPDLREVKGGGEEKQIGRKGKQILRFSPIKSSEAEVRTICHLPLDILKLITENLYLVDYMNFRLACKTFREVAPHIQWRETTSFKLQSHSLPPWLIFADKGDTSTLHTFIDPKLGSRYLMNIPESLIGYEIRYSKEGWLLMSSKVLGDSMFFYNPFIKKTISVLPQTELDVIVSFGFSSSPTSPNCIIVGISYFSFAWFNPSRDEEWHEFWRDDYPNFNPTHSSPLYFNGAFHFLGQNGNLGVFWTEESNGELMGYWDVFETPTKPCKSFDHSYLLECDEYLYAVFVDNLGESIEVCRLNKLGETMEWDEVRDIGNYMFFVSPSSSFSMVAKTPGMENKIFFSKIKGNEIVYYCLRTGKYRTFGSEVAANFYNTTEYLCSSWIQQCWLWSCELLVTFL
ncbi:hypothetical protein PTKIN_Ptkin11bG0180300 [Pterospermum kingtungense]